MPRMRNPGITRAITWPAERAVTNVSSVLKPTAASR
jgi:hypothetical protein